MDEQLILPFDPPLPIAKTCRDTELVRIVVSAYRCTTCNQTFATAHQYMAHLGANPLEDWG